MKFQFQFQYYSYTIFIILICIIHINSEYFPEIHPIISGTLNGTASYVSLDDINPNETYLYFSFDFKFHNSAIEKDKNTAYFLITSEFDLFNYSKGKIRYRFIKQDMDEIKTEKDIINIKWRRQKFLYKEKTENEIKYYFRIKRRKEIMNTLLFKLPIERRNGSVTIENILYLPNFDENEKITDI